MTNITMDAFYDGWIKIMHRLEDTQKEAIMQAAQICADTIRNNGVIQVFGSGHSIGYVMEMRGRTGSLIPVNKLNAADFVIKGITTLEDFRSRENKFERRPGIGDKFYDLYPIEPQDCFIIISNSGINGIGIDLAIKAKEKGHKIIVITSWDHTSAEDSRHPSKKKLYEFADVMIDNAGPKGDALLDGEEPYKVCAISSLTGALIAQSLNLVICTLFQEANEDIPVLLPEDSTEQIEHNRKWLHRYEGRLSKR